MSPMKKGFSKEVVSNNIREMMQAGHPRNQAIAASLASARKFKKMSKGGMAEDEYEEDNGDAEPSVPGYADGGRVGSADEFDDNEKPSVQFKGRGESRSAPKNTSMAEMDREDPEDYISSVEEERLEGTPRENEVENPAEQMEASMFAKALMRKREMQMGPENYAMGGLVQSEHDGPEGNKPSEDMEDETEEPMSSMPGRGQGAEHRMEMEPSGAGLSSEAKEAIMRKKKMRRFTQ